MGLFSRKKPDVHINVYQQTPLLHPGCQLVELAARRRGLSSPPPKTGRTLGESTMSASVVPRNLVAAAGLSGRIRLRFNGCLSTALIDPSWTPWPIRRFVLPWLRNRDSRGDLWNMCHFGSTFETVDMDFFRSEAYRKLFRYLDEDGGFYYERWGDAPVHTLAAAMLLKKEVHHFADVGYMHGSLHYCAYAPTQEAKERGMLVPGTKEEKGEMLGCNCVCDERIEVVGSTCFDRLRSPVM
ncbi:hypothetical protein IFR05_014145 [Cadophora sp. M221]|nr:hypothetical protein IFR05_014145 [Cadophora sp. M221]